MDRRDRDKDGDDGIIAEDITQLVEHIELTGPQRLVDSPEWEFANTADLDDAPVLVDDVEADGPETLGVSEDIELFTETQFDLERHVPPTVRSPDFAAELAAERARWQKRVDRLLLGLKERDLQLAERDRRIEELTAQLATRTLEREGIAEELRDARREPEPPPAESRPAMAASAAVEYTVEVPRLDLATAAMAPEPAPAPAAPAAARPATAVDTGPRIRRYLIGVDQVGSVHELTRHRISIGRTQDNEMRIVDPTVSRLHAMLTVRNGEAMLVDANSRNGVYVNGIQVRYAKLEDGDLLTFGTVRFRYRVGGSGSGGYYGSS